MKWIIVLLLLINGGYFTWQYYYVAGPNSGNKVSEAQDKKHDTLVLLSDLSDERKEMLGIVHGITDQVEDTDNTNETNIVDPESKNTTNQTATTTEKPENLPVDSRVSDTVSSEAPTQEASSISKQPDSITADKAVLVDSKFCYVIGPIKKKSSIERLSRHIRSMGLDILKVRKTVDKVPSHWIYLGGYKSESDANRDIKKLASKSIKDTQLIKRSASNILISVGLFSTKSGADERLAKLQSAGFAPQTSMVTANKSLYWIDLKYKDGQKVDESLLASLTKGMKDTKAELGSCK